MFTPISSLKNTIKKQHSTNNTKSLYKKLSDVD